MRVEIGVDKRAYQIGVINSHRLNDRPVLETDEEENIQVKTDPQWIEQVGKEQVDKEIATIREKVEAGETSKSTIHEGKLYYLSGRDEEIRSRLYIPKTLRLKILEHCHEKLGYMGIVKSHEIIGRNYYWPMLYNEVTDYVNGCMVCQMQSRRQELAPLGGMDILNFPFEKISMDVSGPYEKTSRGNVYIVSFVDWLTNGAEAFAVPDKKAKTVADLIMN